MVLINCGFGCMWFRNHVWLVVGCMWYDNVVGWFLGLGGLTMLLGLVMLWDWLLVVWWRSSYAWVDKIPRIKHKLCRCNQSISICIILSCSNIVLHDRFVYDLLISVLPLMTLILSEISQIRKIPLSIDFNLMSLSQTHQRIWDLLMHVKLRFDTIIMVHLHSNKSDYYYFRSPNCGILGVNLMVETHIRSRPRYGLQINCRGKIYY